MKLFFLAKRGNGGIGDRFVGILSAMTIAKVFDLELVIMWSENYMSEVFDNVRFISELGDEKGERHSWIDLGSLQRAKDCLHSWGPDKFKEENLILEMNQAHDTFCYDIPWMREKIGVSYLDNMRFNLSQLFTIVLKPKIVVEDKYDIGIQIRCGDVQYHECECIIFIHPNEMNILFERIQNILDKESVFESIYVTGDQEDYVKQLIDFLNKNYPDKKVCHNLVGKDYHTDKFIDSDGIVHCIKSILSLSRANTHIISRSNFGIISADLAIGQHHKTGKTYFMKTLDNIIEFRHDIPIVKEYSFFPHIQNLPDM
jgi:hypothetical protein